MTKPAVDTKPARKSRAKNAPAASQSGDSRFVSRRDEIDPARASRASEDADRTSDTGTAFTDEERLSMVLRDGDLQDQLPKLPNPPGFHLCWLSTTNQYDPIQARIRIGYTPVRPEEIPGAKHLRTKSADFGDVVSVNEMILFKLPDALYQQIMKYRHYDAPNEEAGRLKSKNNEINDMVGRDSRGQSLITEEEGFRDIDRPATNRRPSFI